MITSVIDRSGATRVVSRGPGVPPGKLFVDVSVHAILIIIQPTLTTSSTKYLSREEHGGKDGKKVSGWQQQVKDRSEGTVVEFNHSHPHHSPLAL